MARRHVPLESTVGEFRYVAFTFAPSPDAQVFVQFWSEPFEPACWEVSSGRTHAPTERWLGADRWERIRTFGFEIGGDAENFEAFVSIRSARDLARVAHITVEILYSALDYRGQQPLKVDLGAGVHVPTQKVFDSFTTTQVAEVMSEHGYRLLGLQDDEESPMLRFRRRGIDTTIELGARCEGTRTFRTMGLTCELEPSADDVALLTAASLTIAPVDAHRCVRLGTMLQFGGGVAIGWFHERVEEWNEMIGAYRREQRRKRQAVAHSALSERVH